MLCCHGWQANLGKRQRCEQLVIQAVPTVAPRRHFLVRRHGTPNQKRATELGAVYESSALSNSSHRGCELQADTQSAGDFHSFPKFPCRLGLLIWLATPGNYQHNHYSVTDFTHSTQVMQRNNAPRSVPSPLRHLRRKTSMEISQQISGLRTMFLDSLPCRQCLPSKFFQRPLGGLVSFGRGHS